MFKHITEGVNSIETAILFNNILTYEIYKPNLKVAKITYIHVHVYVNVSHDRDV